jgi:cytochrome P450
MIMQAITDDYLAATAAVGEKADGNIAKEESSVVFKTAVQHILNSNLPADEKAMRRVVDEVWLIINAGIETEGVFMTFATFELLSHPERLARLREELGECERKLGRLPSFQELRELPYLTGVILESFRLNHPVSSRLPRYDPNNDMKYGDTVIPKGVHVSISLYDIYLNPDIFPNPHAFEPERWLNQEDRRRLRKYVNNFGRGPRSCIGVDVANMEIYLTLGRLFAPSAGFDMELHDTDYEHDVAFYYDYFGAFPKSTKNVRAKVI